VDYAYTPQKGIQTLCDRVCLSAFLFAITTNQQVVWTDFVEVYFLRGFGTWKINIWEQSGT